MMISGLCRCTAGGLCKLHDQKSLMIWRCSIDAPLTLSVRTYERCCRKQFCPERRLILQLWVDVAAQPLDLARCKAKNRRRSVNADFSDIVEMLLQAFCPGIGADCSVVG